MRWDRLPACRLSIDGLEPYPTHRPRAASVFDRRLLVPCFVLAAFPATADWPAFLGGQDFQDAVTADLPTSWSPADNVAWQVPLPGHGQSSPIGVGDTIYVTATEGPNKETNYVLAVDAKDGSERWRDASPATQTAKNDVYTSRAAPTPVADDDGVVAFFESGNLRALTAEGDVRWTRDFAAEYGRTQGRFGLGGSLIQTDDAVMVLADDDGGGYLTAVAKADGQTLWKTDRTARTAWSSPAIITVAGEPQIVVSASGSVDGYSPQTGQRLWTFEQVGGNTVPTPIDAGEGRFLVGASPGRDGENTDSARQSNLMMQIMVNDDGGFEPTVLWRNEEANSSFGSPIVYRGRAYYTARAGVLYVLDAGDGETIDKFRIPQSNWATPIGVGDVMLIFGKSGTTIAVDAVGDPKIVSQSKLWDASEADGPFGGETLYGVAVHESSWIIRTGERLFRIQE